MEPRARTCCLNTTRKTILLTTLWLAVCGALPLAARPAFAQSERLPKAEDILDKYVEATGGKAAYEQIRNKVIKATFEVAAQRIKGSHTIYAARPNLLYWVVEIPGRPKQESGTDGAVAWQRSAMSGVRLLEGERREEFMRQAMFDSTVEWRKLYKRAQTVGIEEVKGRPAYKVQLTIDNDDTMLAFYDQESHLLLKTITTQRTPAGPIFVETFFSDYKEVGGVLMAHKNTVRAMEQERVVTFDSIEVNVKLDRAVFELPDEVKELLKRQKKKQEETKPERAGQTP